jgi:RimJ/RimL family protein N-acetyltransferase
MDDAESIFSGYAQDPAVVKYLIWRPHKSVSDTREFLEQCIDGWQKAANFPYIISRRSDDKLMGMIEIGLDGGVGYVLAKDYWGQGYMTEALKVIVDLAVRQSNMPKIWAHCDVENPASARVMQNAGMKLEGVLPRHTIHPNVSDEPRDMLSYSIQK